MSQIQQAIEKASKAHDEWYAKNRWLASLLGLSWSEAAFQQGSIDEIAGDLLSFSKGANKFIAISLLVLAVLSITHSLLFLSTTKVCNLISIYFGFIGSFIASYGFLLGLKKEARTNLIKSGTKEKAGQLKIELRRQFSLAVGFIMLSLSFAIQLVLAFVQQ